MSSELDSRTPQFGLRDFLFYLVPGGIILLSILLITDIELSKLENLAREIGGIGMSILGIFLAYYLGQVVYPLNYILRWVIKSFKNKDIDNWEEGKDEFEKCHLYAIEKHPVYYTAVIFRDRSFARFSLAMVLPSALFGIESRKFFQGSDLCFIILGILSACGFIMRYVHYDKRYKYALKKCCEECEQQQVIWDRPKKKLFRPAGRFRKG